MAKIDFSLAKERVESGHCPVCGNEDILSRSKKLGDYGIGDWKGKIFHCKGCTASWYYTSGTVGFTCFKGEDGITKKGVEPFYDRQAIRTPVEFQGDPSGIGDVTGILQRLLDMPEILPLFIGINGEFDKLIAERMSRG